MFQGFPRETQRFLQNLNANNTKEWFADHRSDYDTYYTQVALDLIQALAPMMASLEPVHQAVPKLNGSLRRIHRDVRFSKDKTPFAPRMHLIFWTGDHPTRSAGIHLVFAHDHFGFGAGHWAFDADGLERYRRAIQNPAVREELNEAVAAARAFGCSLGEPELKRVPAGFEADDATQGLLRRKGIVARTHGVATHDPALFTEGAVEWLGERIDALARINKWISGHVETG